MTILRGSLLLSFLFLSSSFAGEKLTLERVIEIIGKEHDGKEMSEAMKIYPKARAYNIKVRIDSTGSYPVGIGATLVQRHVGGKYLVFDHVRPDGKVLRSIVVEFDTMTSTYRKYVVAGGESKGYLVGIRVADTRSISWTELSGDKYTLKRDFMEVETHTDTTTSWRSIFFENSKIQRVETGVATVAE